MTRAGSQTSGVVLCMGVMEEYSYRKKHIKLFLNSGINNCPSQGTHHTLKPGASLVSLGDWTSFLEETGEPTEKRP